MRWGNELVTQMKEDQGTAGLNTDNPTQAVETQICVSKMMAAVENVPSCLTTCSGSTDDATIDSQSCFIDGKCYAANESTTAFGKSCYVCDPAVSQREWTEGPTVGAFGPEGNCVINGICVPAGTYYYYQRRAWHSPRVSSECRYCSPADSVNEWSVKEGYSFNEATPIPPQDCAAVLVEAPLVEAAPVPAPLVPRPLDPPPVTVPLKITPSSSPPKGEETEPYSETDAPKPEETASISKDTDPAVTLEDSKTTTQSSTKNTSDVQIDDSLSASAVVGIVLAAVAAALLVAVVIQQTIVYGMKGTNMKEADQVYDKNVVDDKSSIASAV